jgi:cysteine desulfuration protein SufE
MENGQCRFQMHAESALVKGLVAALCELYDDAAPQEILDVEPELFEALGIAANLTPTRLNGLANVRARIVQFARQCLKN